ncbi:MAG TPA: hypothetical protein VK249_30275 [Anaerolineales bacterium]|nr:hypothetical protein [Anaerolineales bacterium]
MNERETTIGSLPMTDAFQPFISSCLSMLHSYSAGTMLYILDGLCPDDFSTVLDLINLDLSLPHHHDRLPGRNVHIGSNSKDGLSYFRLYTSIVPAKDFPRFWLELTRSCLLTFPIDPDYYQEDESGNELFCQKMRSELIERILRID